MKNEPKNLEKKAWYRTLKILYGAGWIAVFFITGFAFLILKPTSIVNLSKSSFSCSGKETPYSLKQVTGSYERGDNYLNMEDHIMANRTCGINMINLNEEKAKEAGLTEKEITQYYSKLYDQNSEEFKKSFNSIESGRKNPKYQIKFVYNDTLMNWLKSLAWVGIVFLIAKFLLNLIKDVVLYITIGKKFSYWWLISNKSLGHEYKREPKEEERKMSEEDIRKYEEADKAYFEETHPGWKRRKFLDSTLEMNKVDYGNWKLTILITIGLFVGMFIIGAIASRF